MADGTSNAYQQSIITLSRTFSCPALVFVLSWGRPVLIPIALATLLTFLLNPVVRWLQRFGIGRLVSVVLAVSTVGIAFAGLGVIGSRQVTALLSELPANTAKITSKVKALKEIFSGPGAQAFEGMIEEISRELQATTTPSETRSNSESEIAIGHSAGIPATVPTPAPSWTMLTEYLGSAFEVMATFAFAMVLLVFFLLEREGWRDRIVLLSGKTRLTLTSKALEDATQRVSRYIVMVAIVNGGFGVLLTVGLLCLGIPYAVLWGCLAAILRFVPYIGPWVGAIFPIAMSLALSEGWWQPISVFVFVMALELISNNVVEPILFGRTTGVAPAALLISAAFWLYLWGPIGLILSAPFAVCLVVLGKNIPQLGFLNVLLGEEPALSEDIGFYQRLLVRDQHEASAFVVQRLSGPDSEHVFDELLIPALNYARRDVGRGHLTDDERDSLLLSLTESFSMVQLHSKREERNSQETIDELPSGKTHQRLTILGCSADGNVDRTALAMLNEVLPPSLWNLDCVPPGVLTSEIADRVRTEGVAAICISSLPPDNIAHARYLCKKIRAVSPDVPIIVGRWAQRQVRQADRDRLVEAGATDVMHTLLATGQWLESHRQFLRNGKASLVAP